MHKQQQQINGKGQGYGGGSMMRPIVVDSDPKCGDPAKLQEPAACPAGDPWILPGGCCGTGLTIRRYRRKFAVFPRWR